MKMLKRILLIFLLFTCLAAAGAGGYYLHLDAQQTPDEIVEMEKQKTELAYKENLDAALNARRKYEYIVVLNPAHGGMDKGYENAFGVEKDITLAICNQVIALNTDSDLGIFLTRSQDVELNEEMRLSFVEKLQPDMFIDVHLNKSATADAYGTAVAYDTAYYNRKLSNVEFADIMEKSVVAAIEGAALGIKDVTGKDEMTIIKNLRIPAVSIICGDLANETEGELLTRENYQKNLAEGILDGIRISRAKVTQ